MPRLRITSPRWRLPAKVPSGESSVLHLLWTSCQYLDCTKENTPSSTGRVDDAKLRTFLSSSGCLGVCVYVLLLRGKKSLRKVGSVFRKICSIVHQQRRQQPAALRVFDSLSRARPVRPHSIVLNIYTGIIISRFDAFGMKCESGDLSCQPIPEPPTAVSLLLQCPIISWPSEPFFLPNENNNFVRYVGPVAPPLFIA